MSILLQSNSGLVRSGLAAHYDFFKTNLLLHSAQMDDASWIRNLVTVTADAETAPDGNVSADLLAPTDANSFMRQSVSAVSNEDYTFSVYLKSPGADRTLRISLRDPSLGLLADVEIVVTSSWQRFQLTANAGANTAVQGMIGGGASWSTGEDIHGWGAMINEGTSAAAYEATSDNQLLADRSGVGNDATLGSTGGVDANDPAWGKHKLLFEGGDSVLLSATNNLSAGNRDLTMSVVGMTNVITNGPVLLAYGSDLDEATPHIQVTSADKLSVGFLGTGFNVETATAAGSQAGRFVGTLRYRAADRFLEAIIDDFSATASTTLGSDPSPTNQQIAVGSRFGGANALDGEINQALIYNRRLSDDEVRRNFLWIKNLLAGRGTPLA